MATNKAIGLVVPFATDDVPDDGPVLYPGVRFVPRGVGVRFLTRDGYEEAMAKVLPAAEDLARQDVAGIMVIGTSLTFYRGVDFNAELIERITAATGLPASTMSSAVVDGLHHVGAKRLAIATAYNDDVNGFLRSFLEDSGFEVLVIRGFGLTGFGDPHDVKQQAIVDLSNTVCAEAPEADGLLISCGGLRTLDIAPDLERDHGIPVVSSMPVGFWAAMRLVGESPAAPGYGRLFEATA